MALPTRDEILTGEYSLDGSPWTSVASKSDINVDTLEYSLDGSPWTGTEFSGTTPSNIKTIGGVIYNNIKKIGGIVIENINKILNITN